MHDKFNVIRVSQNKKHALVILRRYVKIKIFRMWLYFLYDCVYTLTLVYFENRRV